jgi:long-chain acyl-CoA synthetase
LAHHLLDSQPWLDHYDEGVSRQLIYPAVTVPQLLEEAARRFPRAVCLLYAENQLNYAQTNQLVNRLAAALAGLGVKKGDRIGLLLPNLPSFVLAYFAIFKLGGIVVAINPQYTSREITQRLTDSELSILFALNDLVPTVKTAQAGTPLHTIIVVEENDPFTINSRKLDIGDNFVVANIQFSGNFPFPIKGEGVRGWGEVLLRDLLAGPELPKIPNAGLQPDDWALFQYSGGTTGEPKAAIASHRNLIANVCQFRSWLVNTTDGQETFMVAIPLYHVYGMVLGMLLAISMHSAMVLIPNPRDLDNLLASLVRYRATIYPGVPTLYHAIIQHPSVQAGQFDLRSIKACISGSAPLLPSTKARFEALTGGKLIEGYGLSEAPTATHCNPVLGENRPGSIGLPLPDVDCRIASLEDGLTPLPAGEAGELLIRGPQVMVGYHHQPEATHEALRGGWLHTGDIARMDADGYFYIVDRKKDLIKPGGLQVWPREVEEQIQTHPQVLEAGVAGIPDSHRYETVKAWVVLKPGQTATAEEIQTWCRTRLAAFKVPTEIEFCTALPKTGVGKILRRELVRQHLERITAENTKNAEKKEPEN